MTSTSVATGRSVSLGLNLNLAGQIVLLATSIAAFTAGAFAIVFHLHLGNIAGERYEEQLASSNRLLLHRIDSQLSTIAHDHAVLAQSVHIQNYIDGLTSPDLAAPVSDRRLNDARLELTAFLNASKMYSRIRLIPFSSSAAGEGALTLTKAGEPEAPPTWTDAILRATDGFSNTAAKQPVAFITTSTSTDGAMTDQPRIASVSPLYDQLGKIAGVIAIEADYEAFLVTALDGHTAPFGFAVVDSNGNYWVELPGDGRPGLVAVADDRSSLAEAVKNLQTMPMSSSPAEIRIAEMESLALLGEIVLGGAAGRTALRVATIESRDVMRGEMLSLARTGLFLFTPVIILSAALGVFFGRRVAAPLRTMNLALLDSHKSVQIDSLPVDRNDEIGEFARSFLSIIDNLQQQVKELDRGNIDLKSTNSALVTANEDIRGLTHIISHDLRAPLVNLMGFSDELTRQMASLNVKLDGMNVEMDQELKSTLDDHVPKILAFIQESATKMEMKLDVVLQLARLGRYEIGRDPVDIQKFFEAAVANQIRDDKTVQTSIELRHVPVVIGDRQAAEVFAENLIGNAYKYRDPSRALEIKVTAELNESGLTICVADNGRGISEADAPRVFELFGRAGSRNTAGQGVGLSYCKALAARVDGKIWFESEAGVGTKFFIFLPAKSFELDSAAA